MTKFVAYNWVIDKKQNYHEEDWIYNVGELLGCEIRWQIIINSSGYHVIIFLVQVESPHMFATLISETRQFLDTDLWRDSTISEFKKGLPLVHTSELHPFELANRFTGLQRWTEINRGVRKINIFKNIVSLRFKQALYDIQWLRQHK